MYIENGVLYMEVIFIFILYCELIFFSCYKTIGKIRENISFCKDVYFKEKGCYSR